MSSQTNRAERLVLTTQQCFVIPGSIADNIESLLDDEGDESSHDGKGARSHTM
ncbi:hypothetical protein CUAC110533_11570 [Cutibacterium acnes subsp. elongatum]